MAERTEHALQRLLDELGRLPGIGPKSAQRIAYYLLEADAKEAERLADAGEFGKGSMEPKVRAAIKFVRSRPGRTCVIGSLAKAPDVIDGLSGTTVHA